MLSLTTTITKEFIKLFVSTSYKFKLNNLCKVNVLASCVGAHLFSVVVKALYFRHEGWWFEACRLTVIAIVLF